METSLLFLIFLSVLFFIVAFLYSSVGHGGASGYLAVFSLLAFAPKEMATTALLLNVIVATISFVTYFRTGFFSWRLTYPFLIGSVPLALLGGTLHISSYVYTLLLAIALLAAAARLIVKVESRVATDQAHTIPPLWMAILIGSAIGFISGVVGVGGGIFLSPLILFMGWSEPKRTSTISALFIVFNSVAGLIGRHVEDTLVWENYLPFMITAILGGFAGSWWGAKIISSSLLRKLLGVVLIIASIKLIITVLK